ncbi:MAG: hypothetical protein K6G10_09050 [Butyrivibrio sp.]|nr:hypothetical protein [Butyrivibrio sp.]
MEIFTHAVKGKYDLGDEEKESGLRAFLWCLVSAFVIITICSRSSFLYVFNLWDDANSYFTMGKSMFRGMVPYRDLFDQKGILLYTIYGFASLISPTTFLGVYIMEVIAAMLSLWAILKIYQLYLEPGAFPYILAPLTGALIYSSWNFYWGGSAEEFLFPAIMWGLYLSLDYFRYRYPDPMDYKTVLAGGLLAGCVLHIKFNSLGLFFAWMMMVFFADIIGGKDVVKAFISCFVFLGGMLAVTLPFLLYFGFNGAIDDWGYVYIYKNVFEYAKKLTFSERAAAFYDIMKNHVLNNFPVYVFITIGILYFLTSTISSYVPEDINKKCRRDRFFVEMGIFELINMGMLFAFLIIVMFSGGVSILYYSFPINGFAVFGFVPICYIIEKLMQIRIEKKTHGRRYYGRVMEQGVAFVIALMGLIATGFIVFAFSVNPKVMGLKSDQLWLYKFRDYIRSTGVENPGVINENCFDAGLYTVLDVTPICYYYQTQTLNMDEVLNVQKSYTHSGEADFVLSRDVYPEGVSDYYSLVLTEDIDIYEFKHTYYLYQRNAEE